MCISVVKNTIFLMWEENTQKHFDLDFYNNVQCLKVDLKLLSEYEQNTLNSYGSLKTLLNV